MPTQPERLKSPKHNKNRIQGLSLRQRESSSKQKYKKRQNNNNNVSQFVIPSNKSKEKDQPSNLIKEIRKTFQDKINQLTKKYFKHKNGQNQFSSLENLSTSHIQADLELNQGSLNKKYNVLSGKEQKQQEHTLGYGSILRIYQNGKSQQRLLSKKLQSISRIYEQQIALVTQKFQSIISDIEFIQSRTLYFLQQEMHKHLIQCQIQDQIYDFILTLKKVKKNYIRKQSSKQQKKQENVCRFSSEGELMKVLILNQRGSQLMRRVKRIQDDLEQKYVRVDKRVGMIVDLMTEFKGGELLLDDSREQVGHQQQQQVQPKTEQPYIVPFVSDNHQSIQSYEKGKVQEILRAVKQIQLKLQNGDNKPIGHQRQINDTTLINVENHEQWIELGVVDDNNDNKIEDVGIYQQLCVGELKMKEQQSNDKQQEIIVTALMSNIQQPHEDESQLNRQQQQQITIVSQQKIQTHQNNHNNNNQNITTTNNETQTPINNNDSIVEQDYIVERNSIQVNSNQNQQSQSTPVKDHRQASPIHLLSSKRSIKDLSSIILKNNIHHVNSTQTHRRTNNLIPHPSSKTSTSILAVNLSNSDKKHTIHNPYSGFFKSLQKITNKITNTNAQNQQYSINTFQYQHLTHNQIHQEATFRNYKSEQQLPFYQQQFKDQTKNLNLSKDLSINSNIQLTQNPYTINLRHDYSEQRQLNRQMSMNELSSSRNNVKNICFGKLREQKLKFQKIKTSNYLIMN